jgi:hypothetical protein
MPALAAGIHVLKMECPKAWMAGQARAMTDNRWVPAFAGTSG